MRHIRNFPLLHLRLHFILVYFRCFLLPISSGPPVVFVILHIKKKEKTKNSHCPFVVVVSPVGFSCSVRNAPDGTQDELNEQNEQNAQRQMTGIVLCKQNHNMEGRIYSARIDGKNAMRNIPHLFFFFFVFFFALTEGTECAQATILTQLISKMDVI